MTSNILTGRSGRASFDTFQHMLDSVLPGFAQEGVQLAGGQGGGGYSFVETGSLRLHVCHWSTGTLLRGVGAPGTVCLGLVEGDPFRFQYCGRPVGVAGMPLVQAGVEFEFSTPVPASVLVLTVDRTLFDRHAAAVWGAQLLPAAAYTLPISTVARARGVVESLTALVRTLGAHVDLLATPRAAALATDEILMHVFAAAGEPVRVMPPHRHHRAREAAAMLRSREDPPASIAGLCERLQVSWRTLDQGFRELYGVTPKTYMRLARLHHVRRELAAADPTTSTVTAVAVAWGFFQLGRFAVEYRRLFGEKPSETLWKRAAVAC